MIYHKKGKKGRTNMDDTGKMEENLHIKYVKK